MLLSHEIFSANKSALHLQIVDLSLRFLSPDTYYAREFDKIAVTHIVVQLFVYLNYTANFFFYILLNGKKSI